MKKIEQLKILCEALQFDGLGPRPNFDLVKISCTCFIRDGQLKVSGEDSRGLVDYFGEYRGGYPYIHPLLEEFAKSHGCFWEWDNPGCISLNEA